MDWDDIFSDTHDISNHDHLDSNRFDLLSRHHKLRSTLTVNHFMKQPYKPNPTYPGNDYGDDYKDESESD